MNMDTNITTDEAIKLLGLATKPRVIREIELSVAPDVTDKFLEAINMAIEALGKSEPHWIPVTERLPAMGKSVLICDAYGDICLGHRTQCGYYYPDFCDDKVKDVRAWCELPEPYKGVTE